MSCAVAVGSLTVLGASSEARPPLSAPAVPTDVRATVTQYCVTCHSQRLKTGGLNLEGILEASVSENGDVWEKVLVKLRSGAMPPAGRPRPAAAASAALAATLEKTLDDAEFAHPNPGAPLLHRLNRAEYANAIRDLLSLDVDTATLLPPDDATAGFDNVADVLGVSPALIERYLSAAADISALAVGDPSTLPSSRSAGPRCKR